MDDETDPFGREKSDDPLAEMGWSSSDSAAPDARPAEIAPPEQPDEAVRIADAPVRVSTGDAPYRPPSATGIPGGRRRRTSSVGCIFGVIVLVFIGSIAAVVVPAIIQAIDAVEEIDDVIPRVPTVPAPGTDPGGTQEARRPPRGLERDSLLRRQNLARALRRLRAVTRAERVRLLRVDAESVIVQTADAGRTQLARMSWDRDAEIVSTSPGGAGTAFPWPRIDPSAPARIVRATTRRPSSFSYVVLVDAAGLRWSAFLRDGKGFTASLDGREVRPLGG
jgi:hypothetical protein